jgi:outer membrane receptor protein involved in Fe transport
MRTAHIRKYSVQALLLGSIAAGALTLGAGSALAQEEDETLEEIVVTGSRIARDPNLTGALPIQSVSSDQIQMSGEFSIADVVNDVPALLFSITSEQSIDAGADFTDGANVLNLRGLGTNRTLTLVNGRRHVSGVQGSAAVDVGSIPMELVERVEVLTGGASAIYGADAVTGVVNFIMKDNYEGFGIDVNYGQSAKGDGQQTAITATWGTNFAGDRGNIAVSVDYRTDEGLKMSDRPGKTFGTAFDWVNPDLRFQNGEIGGSTPLFEQYYNYDNTGLINYGLAIPTAEDFVADYNAEFGTTITVGNLSAAEMALIDRAATAPQRAIHPVATFPFTSGYGYVAPGEAFGFGGFDPDTPVDLDNNGTPDCQDSFHAYNSVFGAASFGAIGGCWVIDRDGNYAPVTDGLVSGTFQGFGGSSGDVYVNPYMDFLLPDEKVSVNLFGHYDISDSLRVIGEIKYVTSDTDTGGASNSFWDLLVGAPDNPFLPAWLQPIAEEAGGVSITVDPLHFDSVRSTERETIRTVVGLEGELDSGWTWEVSANYGQYEENIDTTNTIVIDRWFAALDATTDANGNAVCRSSLDLDTPPGNTPFEIPSYEAGYFSFTPGDGQCAPLDIWNGHNGPSQAAKDFVLVDEWSKLVLDQFVLSAIMTGDSSAWFEMPAGPLQFAFGAEYRDESSDAKFDPWKRGVIPAGAPFPEGSLVGEHSANDSLTFRPQLSTKDEKGSFDVYDIFVETSIPLIMDKPFARELSVDLAARFSDYSTIGQTTTWKASTVWAPAHSLAFRGSYSEAVRAPNITELFAPEIGLNFRPDDPCDAAQIEAIRADNPELANQTQANCEQVFAAMGLDPTDGMGNYNFADPLSASFGGVTQGNPLLNEESADTLTVGFVFQPEFLSGLSLTVDYWDISIDDAIQAVSSQNIVDGCYQGATLNPAFCDLSARNTNPASAQFGGFNFLRQTTLNFNRAEAEGYDFAANYAFEIGASGFDVGVQGSKVSHLDFYENPADPDVRNPELFEISRPDLAGNVYLNWAFGDLQLGWQSQFIDEELFGGIEVETAESLYGTIVFQDSLWVHDISARYNFSDQIMLYGGVKNLTDEQPFITENAFPASPRGTFYFVGFEWQM